ncbi:MAG: gliding motility-associated C-terminal domain-containing protein [Cyclobacteriaceae bacterium]
MKKIIQFIWLPPLFLLLLSFNVEAQEICDNGIDDDNNQLIDCQDPSCSWRPICQFEGYDPQTGRYYNCGDGIDNDGDGLTDCMDGGCAGSPDFCPTETDCGNGIDDDGDGFYDYYDGDCLNDPNNPNDYIITKPDCEAQPVGNVFEIEPAWDSDIRTSAAMGMPSVADLDQDGYPEVITINSATGWMFILDGRTGNTLNQVRVQNGGVFAYPAVADVDDDGFGEIFTISQNGRIRVYEHDLTPKWEETSVFTGHGRQLGLADFNGDDRAELYYGNEIRDAQTGELLIRGSHGSTMYPSANNWQTQLNAVPVAVDILPSPGLELVLGHIIYTVNITNTAGTAGNNLTEALNMNDAANKPAEYTGYFPADADWKNQTYSNTAVVDYNQDGSLDVLMGGANGGIDGPTTAYLWDLANNEVRMFFVTRPGNTVDAGIRGNFEDMNGNACNNGDNCYWERGMGNINVADIDNDGEVEATFMSGSSLFALETDFSLKWANHDDFWESSSGFTGTTVFDFDGDGSSEIVYRDEVNLYIVDGFTGEPLNLLNGTFCSSQTQADYPIVADVDGDGETEIVVSCGEAENIFGQGTATSGTRDRGFIRAYKAAGGNYWVPSRALWNQTNYFNVNINDNLTVPRTQQPHHLSFSQICNDPNVVPPFALNKFLNQSPRISFCGQLAFPAPKLDFVGDGVVITPPICPDDQFSVRLSFENNGDEEVVRPIPVAFYASNPANNYTNTEESPYLETQEITISGGLAPGQRIDTTLLVSGDRGAFTLFVSLNDRGQYDSLDLPVANEDFYPLTELNGTVRECDDTPTIVNRPVTPLPFDVMGVVLRDNRNCPGAPANNGEIQVFAADSTVLPSSSYSFNWTNLGTGETYNTALVTELDSGTYRVEVLNTDYGCAGNADTVRVRRFEDWPTTEAVSLEELQPVSSCAPGTFDGTARALINGAPIDEALYSVTWKDEQELVVVAVGDTATNLRPILYEVTVTNLLTGCAESETIDMSLAQPDMAEPLSTNNTNCVNPNGSITAQLNSGDLADYDYMLIQLSPQQDTIFNTEPLFEQLTGGIYEIRAYDPTTQCGRYNDGIEVEILDQTDVDTLSISQVSPQTACQAPYNGQLQAVISNESQYTFTWYRGTVTLGPTAVVVGNAALTPDTLSTNLTTTYTVVATSIESGCTSSASFELDDDVLLPIVDATGFTINHQTTCDPNGSIQASISNAEAGATYEYTLLQGSTELASNSTGLFENLAAGPYVIMVEDTATGCVSIPSSIVQVEDRIAPFGAVTVNETPVTNCNAASPNGALSISMADGNASYRFKWFVGVDTATAVSPQPSPGNALTGIAAGDYMLSITSQASGCDTLIALSLSDISVDYQEEITATVTQHQTYCHPTNRNGAIQAGLLQSVAGGIPDISQYTFYWYQGRKAQVRGGSAPLISGENGPTLSGRDIGWYSVRAVRNDGSGCHALDTAEVEILDYRDYPVSDIQVDIVEQSSCNSNDPNGGLQGNVGGNTSDYNFRWFELVGGVNIDITTNNPNALVNGFTVTGIGTGNYVLQVEHIETGCTGEAQVYLGDNIIRGDEIRLNLASSAATRCTPPDGSAQVTSIDLSEDGGNTFTLTDDVSNYTYQWYYGTDTTNAISAADNATATSARLEGVQPGMYTVVATSNASSCASVSYTVEVESELQNNMTFDFNTISVQTDCIDPDGGVEVTNITGGSGSYTYQWYVGSTDTYPITGATTTRLENIRSNNYMFRVTDVNTGCYKDSVYSLPTDANLTPVPPANLTSYTHVTSCATPNGELVAEVDAGVRTTSYSSHSDQDFLYYWFEGENVEYIDANGDLDDPLNYLTFGPAPNPGVDNRATLSNLAPGLYTVVVVDARDYIASGGTAPFGCQSEPRTFEVLAISQSPGTNFTTLNDTLCVGDNGQATITAVKRAGDTTPFHANGHEISGVWRDGNSLTVAGLNISSTPEAANRRTTFTVSGLAAGEYRFLITDLETSCDTTITLDINEVTQFPAWSPTDVAVTQHQTICGPVPNGSLEVINPPGGVGTLADYTFYWWDNLPTTDPSNGALASGTSISNLAAGLYYVYAQNNVTGCLSSHFTIEIEDRTPETIIEIMSSRPDRNCDPASGDGEITVEIYDLDYTNNEVYPAAGYALNWFDENNNNITAQASPNTGDTNGGTSRATSTLTALQAGAFRITAQNNDTQCATVSARDTVDFTPYLPQFTASSAQITHSTSCFGNGAVSISQIRENDIIIRNTDPAFASYSFEWREADDATVLTDGGGVPISGATVTDLLPGTYYVYVTNTNTNCASSSLQLVIRDESRNPYIYQREIIDFLSCSGVNEGAIEVYGGEFDPALNHTYRYQWSLADGSPMPAYTVYNTDSSRVSNLTDGDYRVVMTNLSTGCSAEATYTIGRREILPVLLMAKLADQSFCFGNGEAEISAVNFQGNPLNLSDFSFFWYENDPTGPDFSAPIYGLDQDQQAADSLIAGVYFVVAENNLTGCRTLPAQVIIEDTSTPLVVVLDEISDPIIACDPSNFPVGEIEMDVRNSSTIITSWYRGYNITDPADSISGFNNSLQISGLVPGGYTILVQDTLTGCSTTRSYTIEGVSVPVMVSTTSNKQSSCIQPNGLIAANVNGGSGDYIFQWFTGSGTNLQQIDVADNASMIEGLASGTYTLVVTDRNEPYCQENVAEVIIEDSRGKEIMLEINNDFQMTNCDESRPNGQLSVAANDELSRFDFFWYRGTDTDSRPFASGPVVSRLPQGTYSVVARDKISGCISDSFTGEVIYIQDSIFIPGPVVTTTPNDRCDRPNGTATAVLDSTLIDPDVDYEYRWFDADGELIFSSTRSNEVHFLPAGDYSVMAINSLSGCPTETTRFTITEEIYTPEFEISTTPSTCLASNGTIMIDFVEPIKVVDIEWLTPEGYATGFFLSNQPPGFYEVTITDDKGCRHTKTAEIGANIHVYNGVSPNGDGKNDRFIISCIEQYMNNVVRIYNRTGAIVYENENYDNERVYFDGYGNRGLYIGGEELPEGTYYYIIDKKNGEKPETGYLELLR